MIYSYKYDHLLQDEIIIYALYNHNLLCTVILKALWLIHTLNTLKSAVIEIHIQ